MLRLQVIILRRLLFGRVYDVIETEPDASGVAVEQERDDQREHEQYRVDRLVVGRSRHEAALELVRSRSEDLVEIDPDSTPPVCQVIDYGKYQYRLQARKDRDHD